MLHMVSRGRCGVGVMFTDSKQWKSECSQDKKTSFFVSYCTGRFIVLLHGFVTVNFFAVGLLAPQPNHYPEDQRLCLSGPYPLTCVSWVALPGAYAPASIAHQVIGA
jgi:hypothetical protein